jgi:hypothetical protein
MDTYYLYVRKLKRETITIIMLKSLPSLQRCVDEPSFSLCDISTVGNVLYLNIVNGKSLPHNPHASRTIKVPLSPHIECYSYACRDMRIFKILPAVT